MKIAMSIAGSDSVSGAGIQADLKTFSSFDVYGVTVITALTSQNTEGVKEIFYLPSDFVKKQLNALLSDCKIDAAKTGMLGEEDIVRVVAKEIEKSEIPLVVDPVILSKNNVALLEEKGLDVLVEKLIPIAKIVTPNISEAERICGVKIECVDDMERVAKEIANLGCEAVVIKGGHLSDEAIDVLYFDGRIYRFGSKKIDGCFHGTGCAFSAAIAANIAKGKDVVESVKIAKNFVTNSIRYALKIGKGCLCLNNLATLSINAEKFKMLEELKDFLNRIVKLKNFYDFIPEVGTNIAYAIPNAKDSDDVLAIEGRIVRGIGKAIIAGEAKFGASRHLAKAILTYMNFYPEVRCVINLRFDEKLIKKAENSGFKVSCYDRKKEPEEIKRIEGRTIPWGISSALRKLRDAADVIYHTGDIGKEPMILIFGKNPQDLFEKILKLIEP